jgi:phosphate/phosphite/phosphonate ABC transporter binding protein
MGPGDMKIQNCSFHRKYPLVFITAILLIFLPFTREVHSMDNLVKIGILAKRGKKQALKKWKPTAEYLSRKIKDFTFTVIPLDFDEIYPAVKQKKVDFILTNPAYYVQLEHNYGAERIATMKNRKLRKTMTRFGGVIFSRKDRTDIAGCEDLKEKRFMAVDEHSFGGWIAAWYHFLSHGIEPSRDFSSLQFGGTHDAVVYAVRDNLVDAGTVRSDTLERMAMEGKIQLENYTVLEEKSSEFHFPFMLTTSLYPEWPMATLQHIDKNLAEQVTIALLQLSPENNAARAASIGGWTVAHNYQPVHACLKTLKIAPYEQYGIVTWKASFRQHWIEFTIIGITLIGAIIAILSVLLLNRRLKTTMTAFDRELENKKTMAEKLQQFKLSLDQILDCVFMFEPDSLRFIYVNRGAINQVQYSLEELLNMTPLDIKPDFSEESFRQFITPLLKGEKDSITFTTNHRAKDGQLIPVEIFLQYVSSKNLGGRFVAIVRDITKRIEETRKKENLQARLLHAQKLESVGQLAAGIAHEINTPTQFIGTNINFLDEVFDDLAVFIEQMEQIAEKSPKEIKDKITEALDVMDWEYLAEEIPQAIRQSREGVKRVSSIVLAMKEFSHPGSREKEPRDLNKIIETTVTVARNEWKYVADIQFELDQDLPLVPLLSDEMGQVILNMIINAAHAIGEKLGEIPEDNKGTITITTRKKKHHVELRIRDTGTGIPEEAQPRIFDPFFTTKKVGKGTGQGLAISHDVITEKHGGSIHFTTEESRGTEFIIKLPIKAKTTSKPGQMIEEQ